MLGHRQQVAPADSGEMGAGASGRKDFFEKSSLSRGVPQWDVRHHRATMREARFLCGVFYADISGKPPRPSSCHAV